MSDTLGGLPYELFEMIISLALDVHPVPHAIPQVNSTWAEVSLPLLHSRIRLVSRRQLSLFNTSKRQLHRSPRGRLFEVSLPSASMDENVWIEVYRAFKRCSSDIKVLKLDLNWVLYNTKGVHKILGLVNPEVFKWIGNGGHAIATPFGHIIGAPVEAEICKAISSWTMLTHVEVSDMTLQDSDFAAAIIAASPRKVAMTRIQFMPPSDVLRMVKNLPHLEELRLEEVHELCEMMGVGLGMHDLEALLVDGAEPSRERLREVVTFTIPEYFDNGWPP